jgi:probable HAF family extracellular repeat protein
MEERSMTQPVRYFSLTLLLLAALGTAYAGPRYNVIDLGALGGTQSLGLALNAAGQVTGVALPGEAPSSSSYHAFLYSDGVMTDLGTLGGDISYGVAINAAGQVTGRAYTAGNTVFHAFLYSDGVMTDLGTLGGSFSEGVAINAAGHAGGRPFSPPAAPRRSPRPGLQHPREGAASRE